MTSRPGSIQAPTCNCNVPARWYSTKFPETEFAIPNPNHNNTSLFQSDECSQLEVEVGVGCKG